MLVPRVLLRAAALATTLIALTACAPKPALQSTEADADSAPPGTTLPERLLAQGSAREIAEGYYQLSKQAEGNTAVDARMRAVETLVDAEAFAEAGMMLDRFPPEERSRWAERAERRAQLLNGLALMESGETVSALQTIRDVPVPLDEAETNRRLLLLAEIHHRLELPLDAVRHRVMLDSRLAGDEATRNREAIVRALRELPSETLREAEGTYRDGPMRDWIGLGLALQGGQAALADWTASHPEHPASRPPLEQMLTELAPAGPSLSSGRRSGPIATLLPMEGRYAGLSAAIRQGMEMSAAMHREGPVPEIRHFDAGETPEDFTAALDEALAERPAVLIGPLLKGQLPALEGLPAGSPPVLALNLDEAGPPPPPQVVRFALSPEQDARAVAARMIADGRYRALMLLSDDALGDRLGSAFASEYRLLGGAVVSEARVDPEQTDFREQIQPLLGARSPGRGRYDPEIRSDVDALFVGASQALMVQLVPQVDYHGGDDLPRYATALVHEGVPDAWRDRDKRQLIVPTAPLLLAGDSLPDDPRYLEFERASLTGYPRLFAFGADAMTLALDLSGLDHDRWIPGRTGRLRLSGTGVIEREPAWARFDDNGRLAPLSGFEPYVPETADPNAVEPNAVEPLPALPGPERPNDLPPTDVSPGR
ncbi:MAG: penicillin-binding protein activator [Halothiobacillaceae bacterium]